MQVQDNLKQALRKDLQAYSALRLI